jgi:hypothetical protein
MLLFALSVLSRSGRPAGAGPGRRRTFQPGLEALEDRLVLTHWAVTSPADNGAANTLRWAVAQAQSGDTIDIQTTTPIVLTHGELYLAHDVTIDFAGLSATPRATISGDDLSRVFEVAPAAHVNLFDLHITQGNGRANNPSGTTLADGFGGAIFNQGALALTRCTLDDNGNSAGTTGLAGGVNEGGAIFNNGGTNLFATQPASVVGELDLTNCDLNHNSTNSGGGGFGSEGGGIATAGGQVGVIDSSLTDNHAFDGGALFNFDGTVVVAGSELASNVAANNGGGISNSGDRATHLFVLDSTFLDNTAQTGGGIWAYTFSSVLALGCGFFDNTAQLGGGIANLDPAPYLYVLDCVFVANRATIDGGGLYNSGTARVEASTLIFNTAASGGGMYNGVTGVLSVGTSFFFGNAPDNLKNLGTFINLGGNTGI